MANIFFKRQNLLIDFLLVRLTVILRYFDFFKKTIQNYEQDKF